ncbi:MAG: arylesterase [Bradyrhizobiaceae bacterium]|nr:arylesterase [Bradyrhizobiaceae bacterium]
MSRRLLPIALAALGMLLFAGGAEADPIRVVAFGDSNTAGFGVSTTNKYPAQLERALQARGHDVEVINAGVSGDTTAGALRRFEAAFPEDTDVAIVFLGRNDMRFGLSMETTRRNLGEIVGRLRARGVEVILAGFHTRDFSDIAAVHNASYYPDFFDGVAVNGVKKAGYALFWDIVGHLNARGYEEVVARLSPAVEAQVLKVFCNRLGDAIIFAPECQTAEMQAQLGSATVRR